MATTRGSVHVVWQFGPYRMEGLIARGGMGEVHRAYDTRHDRMVAVKVLGEHLAGDEEFRRRFKREAHAAARLREPHVIPIHAYGEIDGRLYLDMRLVEGKDLRATLAGDGPMSPAAAADVIAQVASALDAAHADGLLHRDVKPSNVILSPGGFAYLVDFGIARSTRGSSTRTDITGTGDTVGTIAYMAPERFGSAPVDHRVDVYSLACVLYQCLTGVKPFAAENPLALMFAHLNHEPPRPSAQRPGVSEAFDEIIARGMAKNPDDRFASAGELAAAARHALTSPVTPQTRRIAEPVPVPTEPAEPPAPAQPRRPARRWLPVGAAATVALVLGVAGFLWYQSSQASRAGSAQEGSGAAGTSTPTSVTKTVSADLGASTPISTPRCDGSYIVVVGSAVNPAHYAKDVQEFLDLNPSSKYLYAPLTGCGSLRTHVNGAGIYSVFYGPFQNKDKACDKRAEVGGDSFVRRLDNTTAPDRVTSCR